ncbi:prolyl hydroxylase family protein [Anatilimnocola sp. NA78]|uniref:prolyl hydroxylase family protein n=1 Tax=Anatilimnocola sp. NA78 TaxID=3415683 RepID=UPI003CE58199
MPDYNWINSEIFTVKEFFTAEECAMAIELAESHGFADAPINSSFGPEIRKDVRNNERVMIDSPLLAADLWKRVTDYVPHRLGDATAGGINERFRYYRYDIGQQFDWHYDGAYERPNGERSKLTFMIYLNDDFLGGQTSFEGITVVPETGLALFFVHQIRHKGQPVHRGRKYVLRTDVMYSQTK